MSHAELLARHRKVLPSWLALYYDQPIELVDGKGCRVVDGEGASYLDFFAGILTTMIGYNPPEVVEAVREQAGRMVHTSTLYLIRSLAELSGIPDAKVFFTSSGSEANEAALLLATTARRSNQVLALRNSYHGRSYAAMGVTGNRSWSASSFTPVNVSYVHGGYRYRSPFRDLPDEDYIAACVDDLRDVIDTTTAGQVACMIAEPVQGVGGFAVPPDGLFGAMKEVLDAHGILFVADEVQTGWGRTGEHFWGYQAHGIVPDMLTFAKGLGNGLPIGGVVARAELMDSLTANSISTFGGNPLVATGALAVLDYLAAHDLQANARVVGSRLAAGLHRLGDGRPAVGDVRGKGLMLAVELVEPGSRKPAPALAARVQEEARRGGLLIGKGGLYGNVLRIAPPLILTEAEADEGLEILAGAFTAIG
jgi:4-aminobutyrate aminotransferase